jgi:hypothetical protein
MTVLRWKWWGREMLMGRRKIVLLFSLFLLVLLMTGACNTDPLDLPMPDPPPVNPFP